MPHVGRRSALLGGVGIGATPGLLAAGWPGRAPGQVRQRLSLTHGARSGEVTTDSAVLWARSSGPGRMAVRLESNGRLLRTLRGPWADHRTDHTARLQLKGLAPGRRYDATIWFSSDDGATGQTERVSFSTAPIHAAPTSLVWSGDTCGQGFGINEELGGLTTYAAIHRTQPDLFVHCGDTIYADLEIPPSFQEESGHVWRNVVTDGVEKVSETLDEFRGRQRYVLQDDERPRAVRRRPDRRAVGRPRDLQQLVSRRASRRRPLHRAPLRRAGRPGPPGVAGVHAGAGQHLRRPGRRRLRLRPDLPEGPARPAPRPVRARHALLSRRQRHLRLKPQGILGLGPGGMAHPVGDRLEGNVEGDLGRPAARRSPPPTTTTSTGRATATTASRSAGSRSWPGSSPRGSGPG